MSAGLMPLTAEEIERLRTAIETLAGRPVWALNTDLLRIDVLRLCDAAESAAAKDAEIAGLCATIDMQARTINLKVAEYAALREENTRAHGLRRTALQRAERTEADAEKYRALHTPEIVDFMKALEREALFQRDKWAAQGDAGKSDADWFWLVGYLAGKAIRPDATKEKQLHHIITTAAACLNWHGARVGAYTLMRPGHEEGIAASQPPAEGDAP